MNPQEDSNKLLRLKNHIQETGTKKSFDLNFIYIFMLIS